jgi:hypothetical protein
MRLHDSILLSTAYLPPIQYISKFLLHKQVFLEKHENYQKQSYRNRCYIYGANGRQCLVIPVKKLKGEKTRITEVEIDNSKNWQQIHLKSIESAYRLSPFYEYYAEDFSNSFDRKAHYLFEFNLNLLQTILNQLEIKTPVSLTTIYEKKSFDCQDMRQCIHPKEQLTIPDINFQPITYQQVFQERCGFIPNLSIIDLLFNEGPLSLEVIKKSSSW